jgi:hypothetical protein
MLPSAASCNIPESLQSGHSMPLQGTGYQYCRRRQEPPLHGVRHWPNPFPCLRPDRAGPKPITDSNVGQPASHYLKEDAMTPTCRTTKQLTAIPLRSITDINDEEWIYYTKCSDGSLLLNRSLYRQQLFLP